MPVTTGARAAFAVLVAAVLVALPLLGGTPGTAGELFVVTLAAALAVAGRAAVLLTQPEPAYARVAVRGTHAVPVQRGRATDCGHHPHAPRAPGLG